MTAVNYGAIANKFFSVADRNNNGKVALNEFLDHQKKFGISDAASKAAFSRIDLDKDGTISKAEMVVELRARPRDWSTLGYSC